MEPKVEKYNDESVLVTKPQPDVVQIYSIEAIQKRQFELSAEISSRQLELLELNKISQQATLLGVVAQAVDAQAQVDENKPV